MKQALITFILILVTFCAHSSDDIRIKREHWNADYKETITIKNYQQFKHQILNYNLNDFPAASKHSVPRRRKKNEHLMLYVAGGIVVATVTLIALNDPENFTSNSATETNLGIAIGGTLGAGLIITKYLIDKK